MKDPVTSLAAVALLFAAASFSPDVVRADGPAPVVVELFTSQGCNACPPADAVLGELAGQEGVLALSFHVTYWDRLGWPDTFGLEAATARQRAYARSLGLDGLYTPQMVIGGRIDVVGSLRGRVRQAIELLRRHQAAGPTMTVADGRVSLGNGNQGSATVWLVAFDRLHEVAIGRGENRGRTLRYHNVVRDIVKLGPWNGQPLEFDLPLDRFTGQGRDAVAVLLQRDADGAVLSALGIGLRR